MDYSKPPKRLEAGFKDKYSAGIPFTLLLRIGAIGFPNFWASTLGCRGLGITHRLHSSSSLGFVFRIL